MALKEQNAAALLVSSLACPKHGHSPAESMTLCVWKQQPSDDEGIIWPSMTKTRPKTINKFKNVNQQMCKENQ